MYIWQRTVCYEYVKRGQSLPMILLNSEYFLKVWYLARYKGIKYVLRNNESKYFSCICKWKSLNHVKLVTNQRFRKDILLHLYWEIDKGAATTQENSLHSELPVNEPTGSISLSSCYWILTLNPAAVTQSGGGLEESVSWHHQICYRFHISAWFQLLWAKVIINLFLEGKINVTEKARMLVRIDGTAGTQNAFCGCYSVLCEVLI